MTAAISEHGVQGVTTINAPDNSGIQNSLNQVSEWQTGYFG